MYEKYKDKGYTFWCVPKGDSVFTNPGIESIGEQLDSVVSANGNYEIPSRYFERDYSGDLVVVKPFFFQRRVDSRASRLILRIEPAEIKVVRSSNQTIAEKDLEARRRADREGLGLLPTLPRNREGDPELLYL